MFFKTLRTKSSAKSHSEKPSMSRITSITSSQPTHNEKVPHITVSSPVSSPTSEFHERERRDRDGREGEGGEDEDEQAAREFQEFLAKAKRDAEKKDRETARSILKARETNLSPWAGRM
jgi:hypothetical protein